MNSSIAILLLAAGESSRLGEPKQLLDVDGEPLVRRVARQLIELEVGPVGVVIGARRDRIAVALGAVGATILINDDWSRGIGTSIAGGVRWAAADASACAVMIVLCDQPAIDVSHFRLLLGDAAGVDIVGTEYAGTVGVPAVFARTCFERLLALPPDRGAKSLFNDSTLKVKRIACESARIDLDTPEDVARWRARRAAEASDRHQQDRP